MAISQLPQAPYRQDRKIFPTPLVGDVLFSEVRDCNRGNPFPEYGTPYPNSNKWPDHKLVYIKPVDIERNEIFEFFYAAERENQDLYNFAFGLRNIGNREFRTVTRTYVTLRENFKPVDIEFGTAMSNVPEDKFEGVNYVFYDKEQQNTQQEELNALFVIEVHSYVEEAVLDEVLTLSTERQDPLPPKFRVLSPTTTTDELAEGSVETPVLTGDQLAATEDQLNTNLKRKRTVSRSSAQNTSSLSGKQVTNDLQVANVVESIVPDGTTITTSALTVDGSVESLGNGQSVQRVITAPELFTAKSFSAQRPDPVPEKFRILLPTESTEENEAGTAEMPILSAGEFEETEEQVNVHVKRKRKTKRNITTLPKTLTQKSTTNEKQVATVKETLQNGDTSVAPSALVDVQSEALGDGTYVVREVSVPELFDGKAFSIQKPDTVPEKFRATIPIETESVSKVGTATKPALASGELERSVQQSNKFVYREQITKRDLSNDVSLPEVQRAYVEGTIAKVNEKLSTSPTIESGLLISESAATPIGDGKFIVQTVKVNEWPQLKSSEWDNELQVQVQKTEQFVAPSSSFTEVNTSYRAVNKDRSLKVTETEPTAALSSYVMSFPIQVDVRLPDVLKSISVVWAEDLAEGDYNSDWSGTSSGTSYGLTGSESASSESSASIKPELIIDIERPWGADVSATAYYFFLKGNNNVISESAFLNKVSQIAGAAQRWPTFKPVSHTIVLTGGSAQVQAKVNWTASRSVSSSTSTSEKTEGEGTSYSVSKSLNAVTISPTIHGPITISGAEEAKTKGVTAVCISGTNNPNNFPPVFVSATATHTLNADVNPKTLAATTPVEIPKTGKYILKSEVVPYKWGWARCSAVVLDATVLA